MWPFTKRDRQSMVLITIGSSNVSGGYVQYEKQQTPIFHYSATRPIEPHEGEEPLHAMLRALELVGNELIELGAPTLRRATGSGRVDGVLVSMAGPWQETNVRTQSVSPGKEFTFTRAMLGELIAGHEQVPEGRVSLGESVVATQLNGYQVPNPLGKRATRAEVTLISSTLEAATVEEVRTRVRKLYHAHDISFVAFLPIAYAVLRDMYPHERDFLILDVSNVGTSVGFVKGGFIVDIGRLPLGLDSLLTATRAAERMTIEEEEAQIPSTGDQPGYVNPTRNARFAVRAEAARDEWLKGIAALLQDFAKSHALPRSLFLLSEPGARDYLKRALDSNILHALWLSDEPLTVITMAPEQFTQRLKAVGHADPSIFLSILALYQERLIRG